jgi:hypothetical protein
MSETGTSAARGSSVAWLAVRTARRSATRGFTGLPSSSTGLVTQPEIPTGVGVVCRGRVSMQRQQPSSSSMGSKWTANLPGRTGRGVRVPVVYRMATSRTDRRVSMRVTTPARSASLGSSASWTSTWSPRRSAFHWNFSITPPEALRRARPGRTGYRATIPVFGSVLVSDHPGTSGGSASTAAQALRSTAPRGHPGSQKGPAVLRLGRPGDALVLQPPADLDVGSGQPR